MRQFKSAIKFHDATKYTFNDVKNVYREYPPDTDSPPVKQYENKSMIKLPQNYINKSAKLLDDLKKSIDFRHFSQFSNKPLSLDALSTLLYLTNGTSRVKEFADRRVHLRSAPSASASYPVEIYVFIENVRDLEQGIYYYNSINHCLVLLQKGRKSDELKKCCFGLSFVEQAPISLVFTTILARNRWRYHERALRYSMMETGYIAENLLLGSSSLSLAVNLIGDFVDDELNRLLNVPEEQEFALLVATVGNAALEIKEEVYEFAHSDESEEPFEENDQNIAIKFYNISSHFYSDRTEHRVKVSLPFTKNFPSKDSRGELLRLPKPALDSHISTFDTISTRRSSHYFNRVSMLLNEFSSLLYYSSQIPPIYNVPVFNIYVLVNSVDDIKNGIYRYIREDHQLETIKEGTFRGDISYLTLAQDAVFNCSVAVFYAVSFEQIKLFSNRGYRYAFYNVGMLSEAAYLVANALNLGVRGIANFFDDETNRFFNLENTDENLLGGVIIGKK